MPSGVSALGRGALRLAAWLLALPGMFALLFLLAGPCMAAPCHDALSDAAAAHGAMHAPAAHVAAHAAADRATMDVLSAAANVLPCADLPPGASCCGAASCAGSGWTAAPAPLCPAPAGALLASAHAPPAAGGPGTPFRPDLPPPRRA